MKTGSCPREDLEILVCRGRLYSQTFKHTSVILHADHWAADITKAAKRVETAHFMESVHRGRQSRAQKFIEALDPSGAHLEAARFAQDDRSRRPIPTNTIGAPTLRLDARAIPIGKHI